MQRREFITSSAARWHALAARAQQPDAVIGVLAVGPLIPGLEQRLREVSRESYVVGKRQNRTSGTRNYDKLPSSHRARAPQAA